MKEINNFISKEKSEEYINYHKNNFNEKDFFCKKYRNTEVIVGLLRLHDPLIRELRDMLLDFIKKINNNYIISNFEIVKWPINEFHGEHLDLDFHVYTSIIYLNDDFKGGETIIGNTVVRPEKGKLISFEGNKVKHEVNKITQGVRYTLPCWYRENHK